MATIVPIEQAITGQEDLDSLTEPQQALARFYRAFNNRDFAMMEENWDNSDQSVAITPFGVIRGWREMRGAYERQFSNPGTMHTEFYDYTLHVFGDLFYAVGRERGQYTANNVTLKLAARTTNIFRRTAGGQWKQIHHHVSFEDPQMWTAFQVAVRQSSIPT